MNKKFKILKLIFYFLNYISLNMTSKSKETITKYPASGIDLKDVVGSDVKLNPFINETYLNPDLMTVPKIGEGTVKDLKKVGITTTNQLVGKLASFNFDYEECIEWIKSTIRYNQRKQILDCLLYKLEMMGFVIPEAPEDWRHM